MANLNLNKVILGGRITQDMELKVTPAGVNWLTFTIAVNRRTRSADAQGQQNQPQADFITCVAWRQTAEFISKYFHKGSSIVVTGSIQTRNWTDQQNQKRYATEVIVDEAMFVDSRSEGAATGASAPAFADDNTEAAVPAFKEMKTDEDLPF